MGAPTGSTCTVLALPCRTTVTVARSVETRDGGGVREGSGSAKNSSTCILAAEPSYLTVLLRVRGNTAAERWALNRRREFDRR
jgi:hypothetical protein